VAFGGLYDCCSQGTAPHSAAYWASRVLLRHSPSSFEGALCRSTVRKHAAYGTLQKVSFSRHPRAATHYSVFKAPDCRMPQLGEPRTPQHRSSVKRKEVIAISPKPIVPLSLYIAIADLQKMAVAEWLQSFNSVHGPTERLGII